jgi:hypothetical protein
MRALATFVCAAGMGVLAAGCAARTDGYGYVANGPYYDGYYDDYYGPVEEGFWGPDGYFYYGDHDHNFHRGEPAHFRREAAPGFHSFHIAARPHGGEAPHGGGGERR